MKRVLLGLILVAIGSWFYFQWWSPDEKTENIKPSEVTINISEVNLHAKILTQGVITANTLEYYIGTPELITINNPTELNDNNLFLIIPVTIKNLGIDAIYVHPSTMFGLTNSQGVRIGPIILNEQDQQLEGMVGTKRTIPGLVRFKIPNKVMEYQFGIDPSMVGDKTYNVDISVQRK